MTRGRRRATPQGLAVLVVAALVCTRPCDALFGWGGGGNADADAGLVKSNKFGCVAWKGGDGREADCHARINPRQQRGKCNCAWGELESDQTVPYTCEQVCYEKFPVGEAGAEERFIINTQWFWNNWRDVHFLRGGLFIAPTDDCQQEECYWFAAKGVVYIMWGDAGLHSAKLDADKRTMSGIRHDGQKVKAEMRGRSELADDSDGEEAEEADDDEDLYELLGLELECTDADIKKAFRKLSRDYHPDRAKSTGLSPEEAERMFNRVRSAYEVLSDSDKRLLYDMGGMEAVKKFVQEGGREGRGELDPFQRMFGGGGGRNANRGRDMEYSLRVSLEDAYKGNTLRTSVRRRVVCRGCRKLTDKNRARCAQCGPCPPEVRMVHKQMGGFIVQQREEVPSKERCKSEDAELKVTIEKGMDTGERIVFDRMAEQTPGKIPGDIVLVVQMNDHHQFKRQGSELSTHVRMSLKEALTGFTHSFTHLDGHVVEIETDPLGSPEQIIKPLQEHVIQGEGMPLHNVPSQRGDLRVHFEVLFPQSLTPEQVAQLREVLPE